VDNHGCVLGRISITPVHQQDTIILPETLTPLVAFTRRMGIDLCGSSGTLEAGFASKDKKDAIKAHKMKPVISPNRRHTKTPIAIAQKFRWFDRALYRLRYTVERTFGWQDIYRTLDVRFVNPMPVGAGLVPAQPRATTRVAPTASMERRPHASRGSLLEVGLQPEARPDDWRCIYETDI